MKLAEVSVLAVLNRGTWSPTREHKPESAAENQRHGTKDVAKVRVKLCDSPALAELKKLHTEAYGRHCSLTLPSETENMRFLPRGRQVEHQEKMEAFKLQHDHLTAQFISEYPGLKEVARQEMNGLFREEFFPPVEKVAKKFVFATRYLDVPKEGAWQDWIAQSSDVAADDLRGQFRDELGRMVANLRKDAPRIYDTLTGNLKSLCALAGDMQLLDGLAVASKPLGDLDPQMLRDNPELRVKTAEAAEAIMAKFLS